MWNPTRRQVESRVAFLFALHGCISTPTEIVSVGLDMSVNVVSACEHMVQTSQPFLAGVTLVVHGKHLSVLGCFGIGSLSGPSTHLDQVNQSYHILNCLVDQCLSTYLASTFISGHPTPGLWPWSLQILLKNLQLMWSLATSTSKNLARKQSPMTKLRHFTFHEHRNHHVWMEWSRDTPQNATSQWKGGARRFKSSQILVPTIN